MPPYASDSDTPLPPESPGEPSIQAARLAGPSIEPQPPTPSDPRTVLARLRDELAPTNLIQEALIAEIAWAIVEQQRLHAEAEHRRDDPAWARAYSLTHRVLHRAWKDLRQAQGLDQKASKNAPPPPPPPRVLPPRPPQEVLDEAARNWRDHIVYAPDLEPLWPVLVKTGKYVEWYASFAADGKTTDDDILRMDEQIDYVDLYACKGCDAEKQCGPFDPDWDRPTSMRTLTPDQYSPAMAKLYRQKLLSKRLGEPWPRPILWDPLPDDEEP